MSKQDNEQLVRDYIQWLEEACNGGGSADATPERFLAPTFRSHTLPSGWPQSHAGVMETIAQTRYAFQTVQFRAEAVAAGDDGAMLHFSIEGTLKEGDTPVRREGIAHYLIADGRITDHWGYDLDLAAQAPQPKPGGRSLSDSDQPKTGEEDQGTLGGPKPVGGGISDPGQPAKTTADDWGTLGGPKPVGGGISDPGQPARVMEDDWGTVGVAKPVGGGISDLP